MDHRGEKIPRICEFIYKGNCYTYNMYNSKAELKF